jgi:peptide/nickel transport system substrate-binding protein
MSERSYWNKYWSRRRVLGAAGVGAAGAASLALVGCGDDDNGGGPSLSQLATPTPAAAATVNPFAGATPGGTLRGAITGEVPTIDPYGNVSFQTKTMSAYVYSRLFKYKTGLDILRADVRPTGDLAQSAEKTPDGLKWTIKLRPGVKFHNVAPVNGRAVTSDDVKFSWGRLTDAKNAARAQVEFVDKVEYPDASTIVFTLKQPWGPFLDSMADTNLLYIMPVEADGRFNPATNMIGSGPWLFNGYTPSKGYKMNKNPEWYEKGYPLMDSVDIAIIPDNANRLAQLYAGSLDYLAVPASDLLDVKKTVKDVQIASYLGQGLNFLWFDGQDPNAPYVKDERIRQAMSMAADRDALNDLAYNTKQLKAAGIKVNEKWNNIIGNGWGRWSLDPKDPKMGAAGKFWEYNPAEAKKLLSAAGYSDSNPFQVTYQYPAAIYGKNFDDSAQAMQNYINALGIAKTSTDVQDYSSKYITQTFLGNFKGVAFGLETGFPEVGNFPNRLFTDNGFNHGRVKDPVLTKFADAQKVEGDDAKRVQLFYDAQVYHGSKLWYIPLQIASGETWIANQPQLRNNTGFYTLGYGAPTESAPYFWKAKA